MNQKIVKEIKKQVYGDYEPTFTRRYFKKGGAIHQDDLRKRYQQAKNRYYKKRLI